MKRIESYLPFLCYCLLWAYCIAVYFPMVANASGVDEILLYYVLPLAGVVLLAFLAAFCQKKLKSGNPADRKALAILVTVANAPLMILLWLVFMEGAYVIRVSILFALDWVLAPLSEALAIKDAYELSDPSTQKMKLPSILASVLLCLTSVSLELFSRAKGLIPPFIPHPRFQTILPSTFPFWPSRWSPLLSAHLSISVTEAPGGRKRLIRRSCF